MHIGLLICDELSMAQTPKGIAKVCEAVVSPSRLSCRIPCLNAGAKQTWIRDAGRRWKMLEEMEEMEEMEDIIQMEELNFKNTPSPAFRDLSPSGSAIQNSPV